MGNRTFFRLSVWVSCFFLSIGAKAANDAVLGSGKYATKSFVGEACSADKIKSSLDQSDPMVKQHEDAAKSCFEKVSQTDKSCQPNTNPNAQNAQNQANNYTQNTTQNTNAASAAGGMGGGGQSNACGGLGDLMKNMQPPMNQYGQDCSGARDQCKTTCEEQAKKSKDSCNELADQTKKALCEKNAQMVQTCVDQTKQACEKYQAQSNAIIAALANLVMQMMQMQQCQEDQGLDCTQNPSDPQCLKDDTVDCSKSKFADNPQCICLANDRAPGCPGADSAGLAQIAKKALSSDNSSLGGSAPSPNLGLDSSGGRRSGAKAGSPLGGGPGGGLPGASSRGAASDSPGGSGGSGKALSTDVLAGDYGGQGGRGARIGGGYPDVPAGVGRALRNAALRRDPATAKQFTGSFGRTNWQKVKERFVENRPTLLPEGT